MMILCQTATVVAILLRENIALLISNTSATDYTKHSYSIADSIKSKKAINEIIAEWLTWAKPNDWKIFIFTYTYREPERVRAACIDLRINVFIFLKEISEEIPPSWNALLRLCEGTEQRRNKNFDFLNFNETKTKTKT